MKYLILSVVLLATACCVMAKTVQDCAADAKRCKQYVAPLARGGNSREHFLNTIRTTPINDLCSAAGNFLTCNRAVLDDPQCKDYPEVNKYEVLYDRLNKAVQFTCVREKDAVARFIPCLTTRSFIGRIARCKKANPCNSDGSWECAKTAVKALCDAQTSEWFNSYVPLFKQNHPGCGDDSLMKRFFGAMRN